MNIFETLTNPTFSIGTNSSSYNNIASANILSILPVVGDVFEVSVNNPAYHILTGDTVYIDVSIAALATTYNFQILLIGYSL